MLAWIYTHHVLLVAITLSAAFAAWKGDWPERWGGFANLLAAILYFVGVRFLGPTEFTTVTLILDILLALAFLALAVRFASLWLGAAMLLQAAQFSLHAFYSVTERPTDNLFSAVNNVVSWGVIGCIVTGVVASWRKRARTDPSPAAASLAGSNGL